MKQKMSTQRLAFLGMMTALAFAGNYARIVMPVPVGGVPSFTLANILCVLSGLLLGPVGGLASGLGSALYDLTNPLWAAECWITFLTKGAMGLMAGVAVSAGRRGPEARRATYGRYLLSAVAGCLTYYVLYYLKDFFYNGMLLGGLQPQAAAVTLLALVPTSLFNGGVAVIAAPPLALAIREALKRGGLRLKTA
ncbi:ECF transporter S component [Intestinimonas butyriciproducens]|uniref:ECF transporter S component n=1 Tax=Intestinimonas butyriciproducens TaxID=1297617 RepID=UPI001959CE85|nr:ECF transporter S component [Intestinimonas butyriciproducens]MBM6976728.1 ECF transporter S component [Intestinimonas butyriciproducens]